MKVSIRSLAVRDILFYLLILFGLGWLLVTYQILFGPLITSALPTFSG